MLNLKVYLVIAAHRDGHTMEMTFRTHEDCFAWCFWQRLEVHSRMKLAGLLRNSGPLGYYFDTVSAGMRVQKSQHEILASSTYFSKVS